MNFSKSNTAATGPKVRKTTVRVAKPSTVRPSSIHANGSAQHAPARAHDPNRFKPSAAPSRTNKLAHPAKRAVLTSTRGVKRKGATPQPAWSSEEDELCSDVETSDSDVSRKRVKSSVSTVDRDGPPRPLTANESFAEGSKLNIVHGARATSGEYARKYKHPWNDPDFRSCELRYPNKSQTEAFELKWPKNEREDYKPMEDIIETIATICENYFPAELREKYCGEETGYRRRFNRAWLHEDVDEFVDIVEDFNSVLKELMDNGAIQKRLRERGSIPLDWARRILEQTYSRTVSPKVETLRAYKNGSDNVYGELLPRFCSDIFHKTQLNHEMTFVDLGSGVGNVVLQAALEVGCESWGIEMMPNPAQLGELQEKEFPERARLWGINAGKVKLLHGDFTDSSEISKVLKRADVVLVNNQAFTPALNDILLTMFLDLKDGCQIVSLKPFVPDGHKMSTRNVDSVVNLFVQKKYEYFSDNVSWGAAEGNWYIAIKDPGPLNRFKKLHRLR